MWRDLLKCSRQTLQQPSATEDDILPMGSKELFVNVSGVNPKSCSTDVCQGRPSSGRPSIRTPSTSTISLLMAKALLHRGDQPARRLFPHPETPFREPETEPQYHFVPAFHVPTRASIH